jgi:hypothetical protein
MSQIMNWTTAALLLAAACLPLPAQLPASGKFVGTIQGFDAENGAVLVQPDGATASKVKLVAETQVQRVAPGQKDLKQAETIPATSLAIGDRVYVTLVPGTDGARRILVMAATDIAKRNEADRQDWTARGVSGVVSAKSGAGVTLQARSMSGVHVSTVKVDAKTRFRRYAPDSVRFADAKPSSLAEVSVGDQVRARGQKSADGSTVVAEEVVFGTFQTRAGAVTAVDVPNKEVTISELGTKKVIAIRLAADSQLKSMPDFSATMGGGGMGGGMRPGGAAAGGPGGRPGGAPDMAQMLERMPAASIEDLKPGMNIVVSSTKGIADGKITAIMLLANADMLIRLAAAQSAQQGRGSGNGSSGSGMGGGMGSFGSGGAGGFDLTGMMP